MSASGVADAAVIVPSEIPSGVGRDHPDFQFDRRLSRPKEMREQATVQLNPPL
jgi:hypothetical protein